jgi:hypothetical protein
MRNNEIKTALKEKRQFYNIWIENGKPMDLSNPLLIFSKIKTNSIETNTTNW